jgi:hypothetical protein
VLAVDDEAGSVDLDGTLELTVLGVILEHVGLYTVSTLPIVSYHGDIGADRTPGMHRIGYVQRRWCQ